MDIPFCPQCKQKLFEPTIRLVRDSCGHYKCRMCLLIDTEGCISCQQSHATFSDERHAENDIIASVAPVKFHGDSIGSPEKEKSAAEVQNEIVLDAIGTNTDLGADRKLTSNSFNVRSKFDTSKSARGKWPVNVSIESSNPTVYSCKVCDKKFRSRSNVEYHIYCGGRQKPFTCTICQKGFVTKSHYRYHIQTHTGKRPYVCDVCGTKFYQRSKLKRHILLHTGVKPFCCSVCGAAFNNASSLKKHGFIHSGVKPHMCDVCGKLFRDSSNLRKHEKRHTSTCSKHTCLECGKQYAKKWSLIVHAKNHREDRSYSCNHCEKILYSKNDQQRHELIHTDFKQYRCTICNTKFRRKDNLDRHIRNSHPGIELARATEKLTVEKQSLDKAQTTPLSRRLKHANDVMFTKNREATRRSAKHNPPSDVLVDSSKTSVEKQIFIKPAGDGDAATMKNSIIEANNRRQSVIFSPVRSQPVTPESDMKTHLIRHQNLSDSSLSDITDPTQIKNGDSVELYKKIVVSSDGGKDSTIEEVSVNCYSNYIHKKVNYEMNRGFSKWGYNKEQFSRQAVCPPDLSKLESYKNPEPFCTPESIELYKKILMPSYKGTTEMTNKIGEGIHLVNSGGLEANSPTNTHDIHWRRRMAHSSS